MADVAELLTKLRNKGVSFRLMPDGTMQYKDCAGALTPAQEAYVQALRPELAALLQAERDTAMGLGEDIRAHLPDEMRLPCWGRFRTCQAFTPDEMAKHTSCAFATIARQRADVCGDCLLFHAHFDLIERECKREEVAEKRRAAEAMQARIRRRYYADQQQEQEEA